MVRQEEKEEMKNNQHIREEMGLNGTSYLVGCIDCNEDDHNESTQWIQCTELECDVWYCISSVMKKFVLSIKEMKMLEDDDNTFKCHNHGYDDMDLDELFSNNISDNSDFQLDDELDSLNVLNTEKQNVDDDTKDNDDDTKDGDGEESEDIDIETTNSEPKPTTAKPPKPKRAKVIKEKTNKKNKKKNQKKKKKEKKNKKKAKSYSII